MTIDPQKQKQLHLCYVASVSRGCPDSVDALPSHWQSAGTWSSLADRKQGISQHPTLQGTVEICMGYTNPDSPHLAKTGAWSKPQFPPCLRCPEPLCKNTAQMFNLNYVNWGRYNAASHPSMKSICFFLDRRWMEETIFLERATAMQRSTLWARQYTGKLEKKLIKFSSKAKIS